MLSSNVFTVTTGALLLGAATASPTLIQHGKREDIPVGTIITSCNVEGVIALTFDDGPFAYTDQVLDHLAEAGMKATFFINGDNWASIYDYQSTVNRMISDGHQVASHTWVSWLKPSTALKVANQI